MKLTSLLIILSYLYVIAISKIPKKWKSKDDRSLYCNICENILIEVEQELMDQVSDLSGSASAYKLDSKGNRKKKTFTYDFDEDDINAAIDGVCSSWGTNLGTSKQSDGSVIMLKSTALQGSFSGSLNFGGEAATKVIDICKSNIKKQRKNIIQVAATNDYQQLTAFCKDYVSKKCKKVKFPKKLAKQIKDLGERGISDGDDQNDEEQIELMEDDDGKEEL